VESQFVDWVLATIGTDSRLEVPAGDDAAVLRPPAMRRTVLTVDMLTEGIDFLLGPKCSARAVGHKALAVSLSDLAAMGSKPEAALVAVCLPTRDGAAIGRGLLEGLQALAEKYNVIIAGGDTNAWDGPLVISVTAVGSVSPGSAWRRDGAKLGDLLLVTGALGGSLLGRHLAVEPRCHEAMFIAERLSVHAAIDISDGFSLDLSRMMAASNSGAIIRLADIPIHDDAVRSSKLAGDTRTPLEHALTDGEDFELILAMPPDAAHNLMALVGTAPISIPITIIGEVTQGAGLVAIGIDGTSAPLKPQGFLHVFDSPSP
jgi:thiamine-monophosphate kinase